MLQQIDTAIGFASVMLLLSLIITVVVQAISALLDLRGNNLIWALSNLFSQISPEKAQAVGSKFSILRLRTKKAAEELAAAVAAHNSVNPNAIFPLWKAKAMRADELQAILQQFQASLDQAAASASRRFPRVVQALGLSPESLGPAAKTLLDDLVKTRVPGTAASTDVVSGIASEFDRRFPALQVALRDAIQNVAGTTTKVAAGIEQWFHTVMDRAADRFTAHCRVVTVLAGAALVLVFQIDSKDIFRQINGNSDIRAKLVQSVDSTVKTAEKIDNAGNRATKVLQQLAPSQSQEKQQILAKVRPDLQSCNDGTKWISGYPALRDDAGFVKSFNDACIQDAKQTITELVPTIKGIENQLAATDLKIFNERSWNPLNWGNKDNHGGESFTTFGQLMTIALLSLGAPFWFNALRQLANLRPAVAGKIQSENSGAQEQEKGQAKAKTAGAS